MNFRRIAQNLGKMLILLAVMMATTLFWTIFVYDEASTTVAFVISALITAASGGTLLLWGRNEGGGTILRSEAILMVAIAWALLGVFGGLPYMVDGAFTNPADAYFEAISGFTTTGSTANRAVLFSGATIVVSLGGLLLVPLNMFLGIGIGVILVAVTSVATALFLLPALLRLLGHRVNKGRVPTAHPGAESVRWRRLSTRVVARPALAAVLGVTVLAIAASPLLTINLATPGPDDMPEDFVAHRANEVLVEDFGWTDTATMVAITGAAGDADAVDTLAAEVELDLRAEPSLAQRPK